MRKLLFGYYRDEMCYILEDEDGNQDMILRPGSEFLVETQKYYCGETSAGKLFVAREGVEATSKGIEILQDNTSYLIATTFRTARNGLLKEYKPIKKEDSLVKTLKHIGFIPQCLSISQNLTECEIPAGFVEGCPNYTDEKNWYDYECFTDSSDISDIRVGNTVCPTCPRYKECQNHQKRIYRAYYNGSYSLVVKTNRKTGEKKVQSLEITTDASRDEVARLLKEKLELSDFTPITTENMI